MKLRYTTSDYGGCNVMQRANNEVILCIEDNIQTQLFNKPLLESKGFAVKQAMTLAQAREVVFSSVENPGIIILDIHLPDGNGLEFLKELRKTSAIPVIALTNDSKEEDVVRGLNSGCDDYVTKPYTFKLLYARIEALMRRSGQLPETFIKGSLVIDMLSRAARFDGVDLGLTARESDLLFLLAQNTGVVLNAEFIYERIWRQPMVDDKNAFRIAIARLRKKIVSAGHDIFTIRGKGYVFDKTENAPPDSIDK